MTSQATDSGSSLSLCFEWWLYVCHSSGACTWRFVDSEAFILLAYGLSFFPQPGFSSHRMNFFGPKSQVLRALLPKFSSLQWPPSCPHRTVAAEVRKQVSRERSGSPHSSRRCSSSLGVSVWKVPLPRPCPPAEVGFPFDWTQSHPPLPLVPCPVGKLRRLCWEAPSLGRGGVPDLVPALSPFLLPYEWRGWSPFLQLLPGAGDSPVGGQGKRLQLEVAPPPAARTTQTGMGEGWLGDGRYIRLQRGVGGAIFPLGP